MGIMAPDVNTVNASSNVPTVQSPRNHAASQQPSPGPSRRVSGVMGPPPLPNSSLPNSPRVPHAIIERSPSSQGPGQGQGPIRHPRPLTAAELHLELEKEQESIVNRLTRELSALRAQTASVASTASSTSDLFTSQSASEHPYTSGYGTGTGATVIPTSARRHRSSSNLSARSARSARDVARDAATTSVLGVAAPRESERASARQSLDIQRPETSRQNSYNLGLSTSTSSGNIAMHRSTSQTSPYGPPPGYTTYHAHRSSTSANHSRDPSQQQSLGQGLGIGGADTRSSSFGSAQAAARYEEAAVQRQELEAVKKENEALKQRIRDLERQLLPGANISSTARASTET